MLNFPLLGRLGMSRAARSIVRPRLVGFYRRCHSNFLLFFSFKKLQRSTSTQHTTALFFFENHNCSVHSTRQRLFLHLGLLNKLNPDAIDATDAFDGWVWHI
jgi:hypothetical protein